MTDPGWNAGSKPNEKQKELKNLLLNRLSSAELNHLYDILTGQKQDLDTYYTDTISGNRDDEFATQLATQHQNAVEDFLYREKEQFDRNRINHSTLIKELTNQGISLSFIQKHEPRYKQLLLLTYHALYDQPDFDHEYEKLLAKSRLFKENTGRTYTYEVNEDFERLEERVNQFVREKNGPEKRLFTARVIPREPEPDDIVSISLYKERPRTYRDVFQQRLEHEEDPKDSNYIPTVIHDPQYPVATLHLRLEIIDEEKLKVDFKSDPNQSGWKKDVQQFFEKVFNVRESLSKEKLVKASGATDLIQAALDAVGDEDDEEVSEENVANAVKEQLDQLTEKVVENQDEEEGEEDVEDLKQKYESIDWVGLVVENDEDTLTSRYDVTAQVGINDYTDHTPGASENITHYLRTVDREKLGLKFRGHIRGEDSPDTFVVRDGHWGSDSRIPEETSEKIGRLLQSEQDGE